MCYGTGLRVEGNLCAAGGRAGEVELSKTLEAQEMACQFQAWDTELQILKEVGFAFL